MSGAWAWLLLALHPVCWWLLNQHCYRRVWGRPLRTRYAWASQGALLFARRCERWEAR